MTKGQSLKQLYSVTYNYKIHLGFYSLLPTPYSLLPTPYSLLPTPYSLLPSLNNHDHPNP
ncbi:MAG: hypothetical protein F6K26_18735 [Moorea sp. SIO2I5]|nr:hypothetical protein [Moorena sp. SIO2I5]